MKSFTKTQNSEKSGVKSPNQVKAKQIRPSTVILRPTGCLDSVSTPAFRKSLEEALELATDTVVVDLLHVHTVKAEGIRCLLAGMKRASALGKTLSLEFLDVVTRKVLEAEWQHIAS